MESGYCINCGSAGGSMVLEDDQILNCIQPLTVPRLVQAHDLICTTCWAMAQQMIRTTSVRNIGRNCALCNKALSPRTRSHQVIALRRDTQHQLNIRNIILERLIPLEVHASHHICHPCWQRADRAARHYSAPSSSRTTQTARNQFRCANCGINLIRQARHILTNPVILQQIQQQVSPRVVTANDYICHACHTLIISSSHITSQESQNTRNIGHQHVCLTCGVSLARTRRHCLAEESTSHILDVVQNWIGREVEPSVSLCHRCYQRANTEAINARLPEPDFVSVPEQAERITLPNYSRASDTHKRCIFSQCDSTSQIIVPFVLRVKLFRDHNYYIPPNCRIYTFHLARQSWTDLFDDENVNRTFSARHIEDFCELLKNDNYILDFENIEQMDDNLVWYWLGRSKEQFSELLAELPNFYKRATSVASYLLKLRTGDSDDRIKYCKNCVRFV